MLFLPLESKLKREALAAARGDLETTKGVFFPPLNTRAGLAHQLQCFCHWYCPSLLHEAPKRHRSLEHPSALGWDSAALIPHLPVFHQAQPEPPAPAFQTCWPGWCGQRQPPASPAPHPRGGSCRPAPCQPPPRATYEQHKLGEADRASSWLGGLALHSSSSWTIFSVLTSACWNWLC